MNQQSRPLRLIQEAREALGEVREALLTPTPHTAEHCAVPLIEAAQRLRALRSEWDPGHGAHSPHPCHISAERQRVVAELLQEFEEVRKLLQQAGAYYLGWSSILLTTMAGYDQNGEAALPEGYSSLTVEG